MTASPPIQSELDITIPAPTRRSPTSTAPRSWRRVAAVVVTLVVATFLVWAGLQLPTDVPDTSSPPAGTSTGEANDWTSVGQTFVPRRDGLNAVSVVLATDKHTDKAEITFNIKAEPHGQPIRTVTRVISLLPEGDPMRLRPGSLTERWTTFDFEPITNSAGQKLYFSIEGKGVPKENSVRTLMFYPNGYPLGEAYMSEKEVGAHLVFRTYSKGRVADYVQVLAENLTRDRPGPLGNPLTYLLLGLLYLGLVAALLWQAWKAAKLAIPPPGL